jgi:hypothetical protein
MFANQTRNLNAIQTQPRREPAAGAARAKEGWEGGKRFLVMFPIWVAAALFSKSRSTLFFLFDSREGREEGRRERSEVADKLTLR